MVPVHESAAFVTMLCVCVRNCFIVPVSSSFTRHSYCAATSTPASEPPTVKQASKCVS